MSDGGPGAARRPWPRATWVRLSLALHAVALALLAVRPGAWPWIVGAIVVDHLTLVWGSLWPRSRLLGPNVDRLDDPGAVALTFDDGPDPDVTPAVLEILGRHGARATFFCVGRKAEAHPELIRAIAGAGHEVGNHTHAHPNAFSFYPPWAMAREIDRAQAALTLPGGRPPSLFRAPAGLRNPWLDPLLAARRLRLVSWTRRGYDTVTSDVEALRRRLVEGVAPGEILLLHDGSAARGPDGRPAILQVLPGLLATVRERGLRTVTVSAGTGPHDG